MSAIVYGKIVLNLNSGIYRRCGRRRFYSSTNRTYKNLALQSCTSLDDNRLMPTTTIAPALYSPYVQIRSFHITPGWRGQEPSSKVEETIKNIKEEKEEKQKVDKQVAAEAVTKELAQPAKKPVESLPRRIYDKVKAELIHYYHGFRLLWLDMKVSARLIRRIMQGNELNRREHRLLVKTTGDVFRLIPFSVFIIVPFMEFLLPVVIKFFPSMLPSTFQTSTDKEDKLKNAFKVKIEVAKFLQKTLDDMAVQSSGHKSDKAKEFSEFFYKVRETGSYASNDEIMKFSKLFEDEITLDSLSRGQLVALCRVLDVQTLGTTNFLRFLLRMKLRSLAADDRLIEKEGVDTLTRVELQQACRARGMRAYGMPENRLREQLSQWLDLSLNKKVSPSLLLLSRALMVPDTISMSDKLKATISALPDAVVARTKGAISEKEGKVDLATEIEIIKLEEKKIEEEREEAQETQKVEPRVTVAAQQKKEKDEITTMDVKTIEQALDSIGKEKKTVSVEKEELKELKEEMAEYQEDIKELYEMKAEAKAKGEEDQIEDIKVSKGAKRLFNRVNKMISKMDAVLGELEQSEKKMKREIESLAPENKSEKTVAEIVKIDELIEAIKQIQKVPDDSRLQRIQEILGKIDDDRDGSIKIEDVLKVVELIGKEDVKLSKKQVNELLDLMDKEEVLEVEEQIQKALQKETKEREEREELKDTAKVINVEANVHEDLEKKETPKATEKKTQDDRSNNNVVVPTSSAKKSNNNKKGAPASPGVTPPLSKKAAEGKQKTL